MAPSVVEDLVTANRILAMEGVVDSQGHVSVRDPSNPNRFLLSRARAPELVTATDILEHDQESDAVQFGEHPLYTERFIHGEIYKARDDVGAVVHSHSPFVILFSVSNVPLRAVAHSGAFIGNGLPTFEIRKAGGITDMLVSNALLGQSLAQTLGNAPAVLMRGHGAVIVGASLQCTVGRAVYLEENAKLQMRAIELGGTITYLDPDEARLVEARREYGRQWERWSRKVTNAGGV